jgi:hypothetical protein
MKTKRVAAVLITAIIISLMLVSTAIAAATTKSLSTNFTLVNLSPSDASVTVDYLKPDGTPWTGSSYISTVIPANGGQWIVRQYFDNIQPGRGSVVIRSDQPLAGMVQILNRNGVPTSGAYSAITEGYTKAYLPLVARQGGSATGIANSQIIIQNTGNADVNVQVSLIRSGASAPDYVKSISGIKPGAAFTYDLSEETNLATGWWGSAEISVTNPVDGKVGVVSNLFIGSDSLNSYNAFSETEADTTWFVPLLASKLTNSLNTTVQIQNLSGVTIAENEIVLTCIKDPASPGQNNLVIYNNAQIANRGAYYFNTLTDNRFPANWYGACKVSSTGGKKIVTTVQQRLVASANQAMFEAIPGSSTAKVVFIPLVAKRLSNGFATPVVIQNLGSSDTLVELKFTAGEGSALSYSRDVTIPAEAAIQLNFRLLNTEPGMPDGWVGTLRVTSKGSNPQPIHAYVQNTFLSMTSSPNGDQFMAYRAFVINQP